MSILYYLVHHDDEVIQIGLIAVCTIKYEIHIITPYDIVSYVFEKVKSKICKILLKRKQNMTSSLFTMGGSWYMNLSPLM